MKNQLRLAFVFWSSLDHCDIPGLLDCGCSVGSRTMNETGKRRKMVDWNGEETARKDRESERNVRRKSKKEKESTDRKNSRRN